MTTFILFLIAFVALGTIGLWGKHILPGIIVGWHLLIVLFVVGFIAFTVINIAQNAGKPVEPTRSLGLIGPRTAAEEQEVERTFHQMHPEAPDRGK